MSVSYMDPLMITETTLKLNERETLNHIINYLDKHHDKACIELPHNFE
jgi:histidyl-tRNA synthetase